MESKMLKPKNESETVEPRSSTKEGATKALVELAYGIDVDNIAVETTQRASDILCDGMAVLLHGIDHHTVHVIASYLKHREPQYGVDVIGHSFRAALPDAAYLYGCAIHSNDFEPMFLPPTHAVSPVLAPLMAIAQAKSISGKTFLKAFIAGIQFEAGLRDCLLYTSPSPRDLSTSRMPSSA